MERVYMITIENPVTDEVKVRAVYAKKIEAMKAYKDLEKVFVDKRDPLGLQLSVAECKPNADGEFVPLKTLVTTGI